MTTICPACGNNTCNGSSGEGPSGEEYSCKICDEVHAEFLNAYRNGTVPNRTPETVIIRDTLLDLLEKLSKELDEDPEN